MQKIAPEPFKPCVSDLDIVRFDPDKPETFTCSPLINAVLRAVAVVGPHSSKAICDHMQVHSRYLWPAVKLLTGLDQFNFRVLIAENLLIKLSRQHPDWNSDMLAQALGYSSRSDLYRILGRSDYNEEVSNKTKSSRYYRVRARGGEDAANS